MDIKKGTLLVRVFFCKKLIPIENASISVFGEKGNAVGVYISDKKGKSEKIRLDGNSSDENGRYRVKVEKNGFYPFYSNEIIIFPGIVSVKDVELFPLISGEGKTDSAHFSENGGTDF